MLRRQVAYPTSGASRRAFSRGYFGCAAAWHKRADFADRHL